MIRMKWANDFEKYVRALGAMLDFQIGKIGEFKLFAVVYSKGTCGLTFFKVNVALPLKILIYIQFVNLCKMKSSLKIQF